MLIRLVSPAEIIELTLESRSSIFRADSGARTAIFEFWNSDFKDLTVALNVLVADRIRRIFLGLVDSSINCDLFLDLKKYPEAELLLRFVRYRRCDRP
jgi:hypothetical protein